MERFELGIAAQKIYDFTWDNFVIGILSWLNRDYMVMITQAGGNVDTCICIV